MTKGRVEAFSDGVFAIIITIMVLELKVPHGSEISDLMGLIPVFLSYVLSFLYIGIYWNNHHHLYQAVREIDGRILWANLHVLFWLSLLPFVTAWAGENHFARWPVVFYGISLCMSGISYTVLTRQLIRHHGPESFLAKSVGKDRKGKLSILLYLLAIALAFVWPVISCLIYAGVALIWIVPDTRIEKAIHS